jgi:hypothetical protein
LSSPVDLRLIVSRQTASGHFVPVAATHPLPASGRLTRDMKKVPTLPDQVRLRTGDRVRIEVVVDREGFLTVFNVGPTGNLNLLYPDDPPAYGNLPRPLQSNRPLHILDVEMTPPAGRERVFAVWSRQPLAMKSESLLRVVEGGDPDAMRPYRATRDMKRVQKSLEELGPMDRYVAVLELEQLASATR